MHCTGMRIYACNKMCFEGKGWKFKLPISIAANESTTLIVVFRNGKRDFD